MPQQLSMLLIILNPHNKVTEDFQQNTMNIFHVVKSQ